MRKSRNIILGTIILIVFSAFLINFSKQKLLHSKPALKAITPTLPAKANPLFQKLLLEYESGILDLQKKTEAPGVAIAIIKDSSIVFLKGFGLREVGKKDSIDIHTVFRLASVSKTFAPILTGLLVDDHKLAWHDKVTRYLPDFALKSKQETDDLTISHVLSHTTGLPYHTYTNLVEDGTDLKTMIGHLREVSLTGKPGQMYSYQNVAYSIIAEVIASATGKSYEALMNERVFKPLHMNDASMNFEKISKGQNVAKPHQFRKTGWGVTRITNTYYNVGPAGGVNASISDMAQLLKTLVGNNNNFIQSKTLDEIFTPHIKAIAKNRNFRKWIEPADSYYALGWRVLNFKTDTLLYHGGYVNGYRSEIAINRKNKIGICVLSNAPGNMIDNSVPYFFKLYFDQRDAILQWEKEQAELDAQTLLKR